MDNMSSLSCEHLIFSWISQAYSNRTWTKYRCKECFVWRIPGITVTQRILNRCIVSVYECNLIHSTWCCGIFNLKTKNIWSKHGLRFQETWKKDLFLDAVCKCTWWENQPLLYMLWYLCMAFRNEWEIWSWQTGHCNFLMVYSLTIHITC